MTSSTHKEDDILNFTPISAEFILSEWIRTEFNLPEYMGKQCTNYFMRVWSGDFVTRNIINGVFYDSQGREWIVHYQSTPVVCRDADRVACSFREYLGKNYVVIKVWKGE